MRRLFPVTFALLLVLAAADASAWCVQCVGATCWMTSINAGAVTCYPVGTSGCMTSGHCQAGSPGCPEGPDGCQPTPFEQSVDSGRCGDVRLASVWSLESVVVKHAPVTPPVQPAALQIASVR
jgi:hypothetical protein